MNAQTNMNEDLARSGLSPADAKALKLQPLTSEKTKAATAKKFSVLSYKIPYFDLSGKPTAFYRVRFLEPVKQAFSTKSLRYYQPAKTLPTLYFPPLLDWRTIAADTEEPIIITEGEKKAAATCNVGSACIGLGGVWSFRSKKQGKALIDDFDLIKWEERPVWLIFDSDMGSNPNILQAVRKLAEELTKLGALVYIGCVPQPAKAGAKAGLDDYLVAGGSIENIELEEYVESAALWALNEEIAYVEEYGAIYEFKTKKMWQSKKLVDSVMAHRNHTLITMKGDLKEINSAKAWLAWPYRRTHRSIAYEPGMPEVTDTGEINTWEGWGVEPKKGDIGPWKALLAHLFDGANDVRDWFEKWLAYPLQNPGRKLFTCVLLHSHAHGTGKSFVGYIMGRIYGENFIKVGQENMHQAFNGWITRKQFVLGEEITGSDKQREAAKLRDLITQESMVINEKFQPQYSVRDCVSWFLTANDADAMFMMTNDRRVMVHEVVGPAQTMEFYDRIDEWVNGDGPAALFHHLLHEVDCSQFNPKAPAPRTEAKENMIALTRSDLDMFTYSVFNDPDGMLRLGGIPIERDLFTSEELLYLYDPDGRRGTTQRALGASLRRAGFSAAQQVTLGNGQRPRLWALRNVEHWRKKSGKDLAKHYEESLNEAKTGGGVTPISRARKQKFK